VLLEGKEELDEAAAPWRARGAGGGSATHVNGVGE